MEAESLCVNGNALLFCPTNLEFLKFRNAANFRQVGEVDRTKRKERFTFILFILSKNSLPY